ncbi:hypothetical protein [Acinetobacter johnsonii]|uniref:hypothetical protein n=1 Tax=Acinetobacter johnsonii TaxID=40214 RepID=UPI001CCF4118|nr:hypothetical protein [Acinetobacter johnsonii]UBQ36320.1 hypothetical protein LCH18_08700 [Acinetobacter johnsonii]UIZ94975.1 hypothetical protein GBN67_08495 [Acinetobacter johnsonii]
MHKFQYPLSVLYRFLIAFGLGYLCTFMLSELLTLSFYPHLAKAESIYLAAFLSLIFFTIFVIVSFCVQSLKKLSASTISLSLCFFLLLKFVG